MASPSDQGPEKLTGSDYPTRASRFDPGVLLFERYSIVREIGRGGMGVVLLAWDNELEIELALKLVPDLLIHDHEALDDLKQEVLRGMTLSHPGIVRTHGLVKDEKNAAIMMEYVDGGTFHDLKRLQKGGCFDAPDLMPWIEQLCPALDHAHIECHVAHRDLKPRNLMYNMSGKIKIADFGISSNLSDAMTRVTLAGPSSGTPPYMSPQQIMGGRPSHLDDIYSLGATIYELLTGRPPFHKGEIIYQVLERVAIPMEEKRRELGVLGKSVIPEHWEKAVAACISKEPKARPRSAGELLGMLRSPSYAPIAPQPRVDEPVHIKTRSRRRRAITHMQAIGISGLGIAAAASFLWFSSYWHGKKDLPNRPTPLSISTENVLPVGTMAVEYMHQMHAAGGAPPYVWSLASGDLPKGITFEKDGRLIGVPTEAVVSRFDVVVADANLRAITRRYELRTEPQEEMIPPESTNTTPEASPLRFLSSPALPPAKNGEPYLFPYQADGGVQPLEWMLDSGSLPEGLVLRADGVLSGVPEQPGAEEFAIKVKDAVGTEAVMKSLLEVHAPAPEKQPEAEPKLVATMDKPFENTLGMRFVPAGTDGVYFSVWLTRVRDFAAFAKATKHEGGPMVWIQNGKKARHKDQKHTWDNPGYNQTDDHPVCGVSWEDARAFCAWLTTTEREAGKLPATMEYRLPIDDEWLRANGITDLDNLPAFPWGAGNPSNKHCNLAGAEIRIDDFPPDWKNILGYRDISPFPSPVNRFLANQYGLHDACGNFWQILDDVTDATGKRRLLRGGSWITSDPKELRLDTKFDRIESGRGVDAGFRCVIDANPAQE